MGRGEYVGAGGAEGRVNVGRAVDQLGTVGTGGWILWFPVQCGVIQIGIDYGVYIMVAGMVGLTHG